MITIKEIARKAQVSIGTVDRVIHKRGRVSAETAEKVEKIIIQSEYKPNIFARRLSISKIYYFGVLIPIPTMDSNYWEMSVAGIERAQNDLKHFHVQIKYFHFNRYSEESFNTQVENILSTPLDGVLIAPVIYKPTKEFIDKLNQKIPYVFINSELPDSHPVSFIGQDSFQSGMVSGKMMNIFLRGEGTIAVILAIPNNYHIIERADGFSSYFEQIHGIKIKLYSLNNQIELNNFDKLLDQIFSETPELEGIFVANASTHPVAKYLKDKKIKKKIYLIGYDLIEENIKYLKEGYIDILISQKADRQGYDGINVLYRHIVLKETVEPKILMPLDIIVKENLQYYQ